jgi:uncharacterized coiled-coil DUF342 family protein
MSIAEKLRQAYHNDLTDVPLLLDAADEIERLRADIDTWREDALDAAAEIERLREALFKIELLPSYAPVQSAMLIARAALEAKP